MNAYSHMNSTNDYGFVPFSVANTEHKPVRTENSNQLQLHGEIKARLMSFYNSKKIPHIIFHGPAGSGKLTLVMEFIHLIYGDDKSKINANLMVVNCSHGKGIKFIREDLKFFAKTNIQTQSGCVFKTILLLNAHHLTIDAQSALRRCIEQFSYSTRFFIIVENKNKLLNPILSRFCDIYVPPLIENAHTVNLHKLKCVLRMEDNSEFIRSVLSDERMNKVDMVEKLYDAGVSCMDIVKQYSSTEMYYHKIKSEFRCEKMMMYAVVSRI
jgi:DNA polymerase III delta prime subunit